MLQNQGWIGLRSQGKMSVLEAIEVRRQHENLQGNNDGIQKAMVMMTTHNNAQNPIQLTWKHMNKSKT